MLLGNLRQQVLGANLELVRRGLVLYTFGNASGISRPDGLVVIKPSGVPYEDLKPEHMVVTDMTGKIIEGDLRPSSDLATHLVLYKTLPAIGGVAHTHSECATAWSQARRSIPCFGTTQADYFHGPVPVTDVMTDDEIEGEYEKNTGHAIVRALRTLDEGTPGILVANHGPFTWGPDAMEAAHNAAILESLARMAWITTTLDHEVQPIGRALHDKHYFRKHGKDAYYGQTKEKI